MEITDGLQLSDMIQMLRVELKRAQDRSDKAGILFQTEKVELELKVAVTGTVKSQGGIKFWVINAGGGLASSTAATHTFKLTLKPIPADGEGPLNIAKETSKKASGG